MDNKKVQEILKLFIDKPELSANDVMLGYIFGTYGTNEHYNIDDIIKIKEESTIYSIAIPDNEQGD